MKSSTGTGNAIISVLNQLEQTTVKIADHKGHFISEKQVQVLRKLAEEILATEINQIISDDHVQLHSVQANEENLVRAQRDHIARSIVQLRTQMQFAESSKRSELNLDLGQLLSERAALDKVIKSFDH